MSSSSSSSSMGGSLALAAATAVAFSGSLVIFSLCRAHMSTAAPAPSSTEPAALRPCLSSSDKRRRGRRTVTRRKAGKRVRFADDVVDNEGTPRPVRSSSPPTPAEASTTGSSCRGPAEDRMPANREALYRGMLRDRSAHRATCSY